MAIRNIREDGDEILRKKSREVEVVDDKIREILEDMVETMHKYNGVGLAAPQIGLLKRLIVIDLYDDKGPIKLVNPEIIKEKGWIQISDEGAIKEVVLKILEANPQSVADYKAGKQKAIGFLVGQAMKETKGKANPQMLNKMFAEEMNKM